MKIHTINLPDWLLALGSISGAEDDPAASQGEAGEGQGSSAGDPPPNESDDDDESDLPEDFGKLPDDHPLKKSLRAARAEARKAAKDARDKAKALDALNREKDEAELAKKDETDRERIKRERAEEKLTRLTAGFRRSALDRAIEAAAKAARFHDPDDAIRGVDREAITVEQDEDDPSIVKVDTKAVEKAVKELVARKKHLVASGTSDGDATGSRFGGGGSKGDKKTSEETLRENYPALGGR